jgi:tRNA pseudouridine55 synthase
MAFGLLNVFKPAGPTSHDIVLAARRGTGEKRIGHAGTLDPNAEGVLVLALGKATRLVEYLQLLNKEYLAHITLGITTDTYDIVGTQLSDLKVPADLPRAAVEDALAQFKGCILQVPPPYSAVKLRGKAAYLRARAGESIHLAAREITISHLEILKFDPPDIELFVECSSGTYIRSLAHDLGQVLGFGATLSHLRRISTGSFREEDAVSWHALQQAFETSTWEQYLLSPDQAVLGLPEVTLDDAQLDDIVHGRPITVSDPAIGSCRAYASTGAFVGILIAAPVQNVWRPHKILIEDRQPKHQTLANKGAI